MQAPVFGVSDAVAVINQTLDYAYPTMTVVGELSDFRVAKGKWVYAALKDQESSLKLFGTIYMLPGPLEDGMMVEIQAQPRLHKLYGFSMQLTSIRPVGEGAIKKAADLLKAKLTSEGLFAPERKRTITPYPQRVALLTAADSAAEADFIKIMQQRWVDVELSVYPIAAQGDDAIRSVTEAISAANQDAGGLDALVLTRGGGSADDLAAFSSEQVTRAVAASRVPTIVAIGHEVDVSLAELAADMRASTPSNAAELLFPDKAALIDQLDIQRKRLSDTIDATLRYRHESLLQQRDQLQQLVEQTLTRRHEALVAARRLVTSTHPEALLAKGYSLVTSAGSGRLVRSATQVSSGDILQMQLHDGRIETRVIKKGVINGRQKEEL